MVQIKPSNKSFCRASIRMMTKLKIAGLLAAIFFPAVLLGQGDIEDLLYTEVDNLNPVYKPVVGFGVGVFNFLGDVRNPGLNPFSGTYGYKVNVATFVDNKQYYRANFYFTYGSLSGNERSYSNLMRNMNFKSEIMIFGVNLNYDFDNFYKTYRRVHPFISLGFETLTFNSKTDSFTTIEGTQVRYHYWDDGTIRTEAWTPANNNDLSLITQLDGKYETNLRDYNWGLGEYPQYTFAIPIDIGIDFWISNRVLFRIGTSYHFTFSDNIDHVSWKNTWPPGAIGNKRNDDFMYTYFSLHLDLFSSKKTLAIQRLFADIDLDLTLIGDEDNDGYMDGWDQCPDTPFGVKTDTTGCPLDDDYDGVPNYQDDEPNSRYGAYVDDRGVEIPEDKLIASLDMTKAVRREDAELYLRTPSSYSNYKNLTAGKIPEKFAQVDQDGDGYISFDEILNEIDKFFDFDSNLTSDDIYELNNFFFSQ
jgi:hypothetical protein